MYLSIYTEYYIYMCIYIYIADMYQTHAYTCTSSHTHTLYASVCHLRVARCSILATSNGLLDFPGCVCHLIYWHVGGCAIRRTSESAMWCWKTLELCSSLHCPQLAMLKFWENACLAKLCIYGRWERSQFPRKMSIGLCCQRSFPIVWTETMHGMFAAPMTWRWSQFHHSESILVFRVKRNPPSWKTEPLLEKMAAECSRKRTAESWWWISTEIRWRFGWTLEVGAKCDASESRIRVSTVWCSSQTWSRCCRSVCRSTLMQVAVGKNRTKGSKIAPTKKMRCKRDSLQKREITAAMDTKRKTSRLPRTEHGSGYAILVVSIISS